MKFPGWLAAALLPLLFTGCAASGDAGWQPPAQAGRCGDTRALDQGLVACDRASRSGAPSAEETDACVALAPALAELDQHPSCDARPYRQGYASITTALLRAQLAADPLTTAPAEARTLGFVPDPELKPIRDRLIRIDRWYKNLRRFVYPRGVDQPELWQALSEVLSGFWSAVYQPDVDKLRADPLAVEDPTKGMLETSRRVLLVVFASEAGKANVVTGAPVLFLVSDALRGAYQRVADTSVYHDLGCRYANCRAGQHAVTSLDLLWRLFGALPEATSLSDVLGLGDIIKLEESWKQVFDKVKGQHRLIADGVVDALGLDDGAAYDPAQLVDATVGGPLPLVALGKMIRESRAAVASRARTGMFFTPDRQELRSGVQASQITQFIEQANGLRQAVDGKVADYETKLRQLVSDRLHVWDNENDLSQATAEVKVADARVEEVTQNLAGLRAAQAADDSRFGSVMGVLDGLMRAGSLDADSAVQLDDVPAFEIKGSDSAGTATWSQITEVAYAPATDALTNLAAGQMLKIKVSGQWAPTCALGAKDVPTVGHVETAGVTVESEGFILHQEGSGYSARKVTHMDETEASLSASVSASACAGVKATAVVDSTASGHAEACAAVEAGIRLKETDASSNSTGSESRNSASFATGLRLEDTPFEQFPAGALLVVALEHGFTDRAHVKDVQVAMMHDSAFVARSNVDVYLVVNDKHCEQAPALDPPLSVSITRMTTVGQKAQQLATALQQVLTNLREIHTQSLIEQGQVLPEELAQIRAEAVVQLALACPACDINRYPPMLKGVFDLLVMRELNRLTRLVEIRKDERQLVLLALEEHARRVDLENVEDKGRLIKLLPAWSLQSLETERLRDDVRALAFTMMQDIHPILTLRYPEALSLVYGDPVFDKLMDISWTGSTLQAAQAASDASKKVLDKLAQAAAAGPSVSTVQVAVSFVNPRPVIPTSHRTSFVKADPMRAEMVWQAIENHEPVPITILPEDLFSNLGGAARLGCNESAPVIRGMALAVVKDSTVGTEAFSRDNVRGPGAFDEMMSFAGVSGLLPFKLPREWASTQVPILFSSPAQVLPFFTSYKLPAHAAEGLSPVGKFVVNVEEARAHPAAPFDIPIELVAVFDLEVRRVAPPGLTWPATCQ